MDPTKLMYDGIHEKGGFNKKEKINNMRKDVKKRVS